MYFVFIILVCCQVWCRFSSTVGGLEVNCSGSFQLIYIYGIIAILDQQNIGIDITFSVLSCSVQEMQNT